MEEASMGFDVKFNPFNGQSVARILKGLYQTARYELTKVGRIHCHMAVQIDTNIIKKVYSSEGSQESVQNLIDWAKSYITAFIRVFNDELEELANTQGQFRDHNSDEPNNDLIDHIDRACGPRQFYHHMPYDKPPHRLIQ